MSAPHLPSGVNLGGWLCLEDWFFSGDSGTEVGTSDSNPQGQGACLPPRVTELDAHWSSEGHLVHMLNSSNGPAETAAIFEAHRKSYITVTDLDAIKSVGMRKVRVPLTWAAFADSLAVIDASVYGAHNPETETVVVPDPYYTGSRAMVTVPRNWLRKFLRDAASRGLKVVLDLHAFPGGSSHGTYNGIWPNRPQFWKGKARVGDGSTTLREAGQMVVRGLVSFVESLSGPERAAIYGLTLMNEPAHLSFGADWSSESRMLSWVAEAAGHFRSSKLPRNGVKLFVSVIDTAFGNSGGRFWDVVPGWWRRTFTTAEQRQWAVMDLHWYSAWGGAFCSGRDVDGGAYSCSSPLSKIRAVQKKCVGAFTKSFKANFHGLRVVSEFSLGTFDQAKHACKEKAVVDSLLDEQVKAYDAAGIESYFWTWRMPHGKTFQPGWSLKYVLGLENDYNSSTCLPPGSSRRRSAVQCTADGLDPYKSGNRVVCCSGLHEVLKDWEHNQIWFYKCVTSKVVV